MTRNGDQPAAAPTARLRVAVAGATGFAGQELVRLLARHPHARSRPPPARKPTSTPRRLPALARIWDGTVVPLDASGRRERRRRVPRAARSGVGRDRADAAGRRPARDRSVGRVPAARRRRAREVVPGDQALPAGVVYGLTEFELGAHPRARAAVEPGLLPDGVAAGAAAAGSAPGCCSLAPNRDRREVGHLGRGQGADRSHALLREPRQRGGLRAVRPPPHAGDGAGARARRDLRPAPGAARPRHPLEPSTRALAPGTTAAAVADGARARVCGGAVRAADRRRAARDQARRAHELLRHRLEGRRARRAASSW